MPPFGSFSHLQDLAAPRCEAARNQTAPFVIAAAKSTASNSTGISNWFNSAPLSMANLRGKVVLVDFWTYGCVNCVNTLPHVTELYAKYRDRGLVIVGIHTPEFPFERSASNVQAALKRHGITYPRQQAGLPAVLSLFLSLALFTLSYAGFGISMWPHIVPQSVRAAIMDRAEMRLSGCFLVASNW
jgi:thiol-disulfide isomerase/thioredoxin